ncbi:MAG: cob(I)yrinic acid a,c-diamide adenosyltransferase [Patescibacteria group bacterium]
MASPSADKGRRTKAPKGKHRKTGLAIYYYGDGKGKTTAAIGIAVRAAAYGLKVLYFQFMKGTWPSGERKSLVKIPGITVEAVGEGFVGILDDTKPRRVHVTAAKHGLTKVKKLLTSGMYDVVVCDEAVSAVEANLLSVRDVAGLMRVRPERVTLVITGHDRYPTLEKQAHLVTEMKMIKHPYYQGILAQKGIDF